MEDKVPSENGANYSGTPDNTPDEAVEQGETRTIYHNTYDHGFTNGILKVPSEHFANFIEATSLEQLSKKELGITLNALEQQQSELKQSRARLVELNQAVALHTEEIEACQENIGSALDQIKDSQDEKDRLLQFKDKIPVEYNWYNTFWYIAIGYLFIFADVFITYDAFRQALNMNRTEGLILAIAVAGITFVIKPLIDRLFEKNYWKGSRRRMHGLLITASSISLIVLALLGYFRQAYFAENQMASTWKSQIAILKEEASDIENYIANYTGKGNETMVKGKSERLRHIRENAIPELNTKILHSQNKTGESSILVIIFILANILFAFSSAICLSIAFSSFDALLQRIKLTKRICQLESKLENMLRSHLKTVLIEL